jgi:hypothetical protein
MILRYGNHSRANGEVEVVISRNALRTEANTPWAYEEMWALNGMIVSQAGSLADIKAKTAALEAAFEFDGSDVKLMNPNGTTVSHHQILNANTLGGVKIATPISYQDGKGPQGVCYRNWSCQLKAVIPFATSALETRLHSFTESVEFQGGGFRRGTVETLVGRPVPQTFRQRTSCKVVQRGEAVGLYAYPSIPSPIWPVALADGAPVVTYGQPKRDSGSLTMFPISWQWTFDSPTPLSGRPHIWGVTYVA